MSCDWETVKNVVPGNSSIKLDQTGGDGKDVKQYTTISYLSVQQSKLSPRCAMDDPMNCCPRPKASATVHRVIHSTEGGDNLTVAQKGMK